MPLHQFGISFSNLFIASTRERELIQVVLDVQSYTPSLRKGIFRHYARFVIFLLLLHSIFTTRTSVHEKALKICWKNARNIQAIQNYVI